MVLAEMLNCRLIRLTALAAIAVVANPGWTAECANSVCDDPVKTDRYSVHVLLENDLVSESLGFGHSDRWYTNGVKVMVELPDHATQKLIDRPTVKKAMDWARPATDKIIRFDDMYEGGHYAFALGQLMFTPQNIIDPNPQPFDRPWAGWLYVGGIFQSEPVNHVIHTLELDAGVVGRYSFARQTQQQVHRTFGYHDPQGWGNQLRSEIGVQLTYNNSRRLTPVLEQGLGVDVYRHYGFALGTMFDRINTGLTGRVGFNLDDASIGTIENPTLEGGAPSRTGAYLMASVDAQGVLHNTFVDGSLFRSDPYQMHVHHKSLVLQGSTGVVFEFGNRNVRRIGILINRRTAEFKSPTNTQAVQTFGTAFVEFGI